MRIKFFVLIFFFIFINIQAKAEPLCETFYKKVYEEKIYPRDSQSTDIGESVIGFRLKYIWNDEKESFVPKKNKEGYYYVGKTTKVELIDKIQTGDIILSINKQDVRNTFDGDEIEGGYISEKYKKKEKIDLELSRRLPNGKIKIFNIETTNDYHDYNNPSIDFMVNNIEINEKKGTIDLSFKGEFYRSYDTQWNITNTAHETLGFNREDGSPATNGDYLKRNISFNECLFTDEEWKKLNTVDPNKGLEFANIVSEKVSDKKSYYYINANYNQEAESPDEIDKVLYVEYFVNSIITLQNKFNLKNFPFDKQKIEIFIYQNFLDLDSWKSGVSSFTYKNAEKFVNANTIQGWNVKSFDMNYKIYDDPYYGKEYDGFSLTFDIERKSGYYVFKIIIPIILILAVCWSACWINPREIESRLTVTIVCLLSLIAYNFVIDSDMPKLEYLTIMDYIILVSYVYATIPNFLSIYSFQLIKKNKKLTEKYETLEKRYGLPSYILIILIIILINVNIAPEHTSSMFSWASFRN